MKKYAMWYRIGVFFMLGLFVISFQGGHKGYSASDMRSDKSHLEFPLDSIPYNMTWGDWSAEWWRWLMSIPMEKNPANDTTGINCAENQSGPVWFLAGSTETG